MSKKLLFPIVAVALAIITVVVGVFVIMDNVGDCVVSIQTQNVLIGDTVSVPVVIEKNPGIWGGQIIIDYNSKNLSYVSMSKGEVFEECEVNDAGDCVVLLVTQTMLENSKKDGTVAVLNFRVKTTSSKGKQSLSFNKETNFCNVDEKMIEPELKDGTIVVK